VGALGSHKHGRHVPQQLLNPSARAQNLQQAHTSAALAAMMQGGGGAGAGAGGATGDGHNPFEAFLGQPFQGHAPPMPDLTALNASLEGARAALPACLSAPRPPAALLNPDTTRERCLACWTAALLCVAVRRRPHLPDGRP